MGGTTSSRNPRPKGRGFFISGKESWACPSFQLGNEKIGRASESVVFNLQ